jgi:hypothetical protein
LVFPRLKTKPNKPKPVSLQFVSKGSIYQMRWGPSTWGLVYGNAHGKELGYCLMTRGIY